MAEYINREDAKKALIGWDTDPTDEEIEYALDNIPTADVVEVVHGRWIRPTMINGRTFDIPHCSACGDVPCDTKNYCPKCGAKMDGDKNG